MILTVTVPTLETFMAYDYGYGTVLDVRPAGLKVKPEWVTVTVEYNDGDRYHAQCQLDRFASGSYFASIA